MRSADLAWSAAEPARGERVQIGGVAGADVDAVTLARFARALGPGRQLLAAPARTFVGDWDACRLSAGELEQRARQGRLDEVQGAFALAWLDGEALHLVRDPVGERGAYYARVGGGIAFASTLRPLLESGIVPRTLNTAALPAYLSFGYLPGRATLVEGIFELLPGQHLVCRDGVVREERIWVLPSEDAQPEDEEVYRRRLRARLEEAVRRRLPAGNVAATLSGGIDSSVVVALASRLHDDPVSTFSLSFGRGIPNELEHAAAVAAYCGTDHHVVDLSPRTVMDRFDGTMAALSTPIGEPLTVANSVLFETASQYSSVVLNGEGGDPCFGGPKNVPMLLHELYGIERLERSYFAAHRKCFAELDRMLDPDILACGGLEELVAPHLRDPRWSTLVNRLMALNLTFKGAHHILPKVDQLSRPYEVLPRSPLFDRGVVDVALRMPAELKLRGPVEKFILKRAVEDLLPPAIVERRKSGMRVPVETWLEGKFNRFARERLLDGLAPYGIVRRSYLEELARPDRKLPPPRRGVKIWLLLSLEAWLRTVLAPPSVEGAALRRRR